MFGRVLTSDARFKAAVRAYGRREKARRRARFRAKHPRWAATVAFGSAGRLALGRAAGRVAGAGRNVGVARVARAAAPTDRRPFRAADDPGVVEIVALDLSPAPDGAGGHEVVWGRGGGRRR